MAQKFASICGLSNPEKHKPHGKRAFGITLLSNSSCATAKKLKASRHLHSNTQALYQQANIVDTDKRQEAMNPPLSNKASSPGDDENSSHSSSVMRSGDSVPASLANCGVLNIVSPYPTTSVHQ